MTTTTIHNVCIHCAYHVQCLCMYYLHFMLHVLTPYIDRYYLGVIRVIKTIITRIKNRSSNSFLRMMMTNDDNDNYHDQTY